MYVCLQTLWLWFAWLVTDTLHLYTVHYINIDLSNEMHLCNFYEGSESCQGWAGVHPFAPTVVDCPSEQGVCPSEKEGGPQKKASSDGLDRKTKPERCPCGHTSWRHKRTKVECNFKLITCFCFLCMGKLEKCVYLFFPHYQIQSHQNKHQLLPGIKKQKTKQNS